MPVKIRLQRHGAKKRPFYFIVIADENAPRDGKFIEKIGSYNPLTSPATILLKSQRALYWLEQGAIPTETVRKILSFKGVLYLKHLLRGVKLGLFDEQTALQKFEDWQKEHENDVLDRKKKHTEKQQKEKEDAMKASAVAKKVKVDEAQAAATAEASEGEEVATEEAPEATAETATEEAPAAEAEAAPEETPAEDASAASEEE